MKVNGRQLMSSRVNKNASLSVYRRTINNISAIVFDANCMTGRFESFVLLLNYLPVDPKANNHRYD